MNRYNTAEKKYRKEENRNAAVVPKPNEKSDDKGPSMSMQHQRKDDSDSDNEPIATSLKSSMELEDTDERQRVDCPIS